MTDFNQAALDRITATQSWLADVPTPPDAINPSPWANLNGDGYNRVWTTNTTTIPTDDGDATVYIHAVQTEDGTVTRTVVVEAEALALTPEQACTLAAALLDAASRTLT